MNRTSPQADLFAATGLEALKALSTAIFILDGNEAVVFRNTAAREFPRFGKMPVPDLAALERLLPMYKEDGKIMPCGALHPARQALQREAVREAEYLVRPPGSLPYWVEFEAKPIELSDGNRGAMLTLKEITERKRRERSQNAWEMVQQFAFHENLAGLLHTTVDGRILHVNDTIVKMLGYTSSDEFRTLRAWQIYWEPAERDRMLRAIIGKGRLHEYEAKCRTKDGQLRWALMNSRMIEAGADEVGGTLVSSMIDITERKAHEESLRQSQSRFTTFMCNLPGVAFIKDLTGRYVYYNEASQRLFGLSPDWIVGKTDEEVWPAKAASTFRDNDALVIERAQPVEIIELVPHGAGTHTWLFNKFPILEGHQVIGVGGVGIDVTERMHLQEELTQARKMEALGRLAGGIAHDFNNLLTVISGYGQMALEGIGTAPPDRLSSYVQDILNSSRRAAGLTNQLLAFSRRQNVQPKVMDLRELLHNMERMLQRVIGEHVDLKVRCSPDPCLIRADSHQLEQVVMNLAVNARDAMPLGGLLDIECSLLPGVPAPSILPGTALRGSSPTAEGPGVAANSPVNGSAGEVMLLVRDTGVGMDGNTLSRLFEPFFTSKEKGKGTGLGLSTAYGIVKQAGGRIEVVSAPSEGASFRIYLPLAEGQPSGAHSSHLAPRSLAGTETILLVEDELSVRELAREILGRLGYKVLVADSGKSAMDVWEKVFGKVDLLLTDVIMPHMSGGELAHRLRSRNSRLRVLFMSGYTDDMIASHGKLEGGTQLLPKPFTSEELGGKIRELLET